MKDNIDERDGCMGLLRSIHYSKKVAVAVLFIVFMLDLILLTAIEPVLPELLKDIEDAPDSSVDTINPILVGVLNGAKPLTTTVMNPLFGCLINRYSHNVPMMAGFCFALFSTLGFAYATNFSVLLLLRCLQGMGSSLLTIGGLTMVSDAYRDPVARGKALAVGFTGLAAGLIIGFPFGSMFYAFFGKEATFLSLCGLVVVGATIRFCLMPIWVYSEGQLPEKDDPECCDELIIALGKCQNLWEIFRGHVFYPW